jgi:hypothetical protein
LNFLSQWSRSQVKRWIIGITPIPDALPPAVSFLHPREQLRIHDPWSRCWVHGQYGRFCWWLRLRSSLAHSPSHIQQMIPTGPEVQRCGLTGHPTGAGNELFLILRSTAFLLFFLMLICHLQRGSLTSHLTSPKSVDEPAVLEANSK